MVRTLLPLQRAQVQSLLRELRSCKLGGGGGHTAAAEVMSRLGGDRHPKQLLHSPVCRLN